MNKYFITLAAFFCAMSPIDLQAQRRAKYELENKQHVSATEAKLEAPEKKEIYRIDFILPLATDQLPDSVQVLKEFPQQGLLGLHFYEGILLAIDSLEKSGKMYYDIYVHDLSSSSIEQILSEGQLDSTDVIVGALQGNDVRDVAEFSKKHGISFFSAISPSDQGITENAYFVMLQPSLRSHLHHSIRFVEYNKSYLNTLVLYSPETRREKARTIIEDQIKAKYKSVQISSNSDYKNLRYYLDKGKKNVVYTTELDPEKAAEILRSLNEYAEEYPMEVIGLPTWKGMPILTSGEIHNNISVYISYPFRYDEEIEKRQEMRNKYAMFKRGIPNEMIYRGFETTLWIADALERNGTPSHNNLAEVPTFSTEYRIEKIEQKGKLAYYENTNTYIYKYHKGTLSVVE